MNTSTIKPLPLALPCPAWHTAIDPKNWSSGDDLRNWISTHSDEELLKLESTHDQWFKFFFGEKASCRDGSGRYLTQGAWMEELARASEVRQHITHVIVYRFKRGVEKRREATEKATETKKWKRLKTRRIAA